MKIETKYSIGDKVVKIGFNRKQENVKCDACSGRGGLVLDNGDTTRCPKCRNRGFVTVWHDQVWQILGTYRIGQVNAKITNIISDGDFDNVGHQGDDTDTKYEISYMCYETGIGSGTVHYENTLYENRYMAQNECNKRNFSGI